MLINWTFTICHCCMSPHHTIEIHLQFLGTRNTDNKRSSVKTCCFGEGEMLINWTFTICHCCMSPHHTIEIHLQFLGTRNTDNKSLREKLSRTTALSCL
ncbi:uncharacterized protein [Zea mays]|uniref:uncharacterized protein isoform X4 n=1 Tax=Zea mays TaxID=4577 RepID=UPI0009AA392D|nr:uncharacterized protein LOC109941998 isoform X4 [Zea mays]|eukprot:XP_020398940.1 uncharacterized protein LOC109941998 isoform X4 [Zea mays]